MTVNLLGHKIMKEKTLRFLNLSNNDSFIINKIFGFVEDVLYEKKNISEVESLIDDDYNVVFDFFAAIYSFDSHVSNLFFDNSFEHDVSLPDIVIKNDLNELVSFAHEKIKDSTNNFFASLFYYQFLSSVIVGGFTDNEVFEEIDFDLFLVPYKEVKPKAVAYVLQTEYSGFTVKSVPSSVEPIDLSLYPEYLIMDNPHLFYKDGKAYLKIDIMNAITAAGGVAQTLEKQDLEGGTTNAARKKDKKRNASKSNDSEANSDNEKTK